MIYAGSDLRSAVGVAESLAREAPRAALVFPDELTRAGLAERLTGAARRRAVLVSSAPEPGSTDELRGFEDAFTAAFGHRPDPYAVLAWQAERRILEAIRAAGSRANLRRVVVEQYMALPALRHASPRSARVPAGGARTCASCSTEGTTRAARRVTTAHDGARDRAQAGDHADDAAVLHRRRHPRRRDLCARRRGRRQGRRRDLDRVRRRRRGRRVHRRVLRRAGLEVPAAPAARRCSCTAPSGRRCSRS